MAAWLGILGTVIGVVVGAIVQTLHARHAFSREKRWSIFTEQRERIEQIYVVVEEHRQGYASIFAAAISELQGEHLALPATRVPWARLRMLVALYAPEMESHMARLNEVGTTFGISAGEVLTQGSMDAAERTRRLVELPNQFNELNAVYDALLRDLIVAAERLTKSQVAAVGEVALPRISVTKR